MTPQPALSLRESDDIQGNILAGLRKDRQTFLFLELPDEARGRAWLGDLVPRGGPSRIASTREVAAFNREFSEARRKLGGADPEGFKAVWVNLAVTASGLGKLAPRLRPGWERFHAFTEGPVARAARLRDRGPSEPARWVVGRPDQAIDALLTVAADDPADLRLEVERMHALAFRHGVALVSQQDGATLPGARGYEHFGFKDGISQPGVVGFDEADDNRWTKGDAMIAAGEFVLGYVRAGGRAPWDHPAWMRDGSFQVFRRLRQDVHGWWARVAEAVRELPGRDSMTEDLLGAKLVGRWRSGTPLARAPEREDVSAGERSHNNDFDFDGDADGRTTPRFAHIRKMYPRDAALRDDRRRILRRGIPFGPPFNPPADRGRGGDAERGLLFNAFMASIDEQFEHLQGAWANAPDFPGIAVGDRKRDGPDPVIGDDEAPLRLVRARHADAEIEFRRFVETTGAVYAFAPSIRTLRDLGSGRLG
ncbi:MAG: Dyp-type peroxidase [Actinomycetota bacterium]|nr:Dyp-type peroxidase [Actinomycetota bacterium]